MHCSSARRACHAVPQRAPISCDAATRPGGIHPKIVSEMLGHSTVSITLDVYSLVTPAIHREAARAMDEILS